ncbi:MAG: hypothetical protein VX589_18430 [Myxococcota bacterium]|nr:hypothetical protein [Myxococcota bacterium]
MRHTLIRRGVAEYYLAAHVHVMVAEQAEDVGRRLTTRSNSAG